MKNHLHFLKSALLFLLLFSCEAETELSPTAVSLGDSKISPGGGTTLLACGCPSPFIDDMLCVSGGHPYWRFHLDGTSTGDNIYWYGNHITVTSGQGGTYVVANPTDASGGYFTLYCRVTRPCSGGPAKVRTAYYTNYYGGSCGGGTTGFSGACSGPILD